MTGRNSRPSREHVLIDRCVTPQLVAPLHRLHQIRAATLAEVFGKDYSQTMADVEWIEYCGRNGVVALTANVEIWKVAEERACILAYCSRILAMKANVTRLESAMIIGQNIRLLRNAINAKGCGPEFTQITSGPPTRRQLE